MGSLPAWCCCIAALLLACTRAAVAHPLGNFTINHLARVSASHGTLRIHYVLDIAEIPTFQIMQSVGGTWTPQRSREWSQREAAVVSDGLHVIVDDRPARLHLRGAPHSRTRPGAGGLSILYWTADFVAPITQQQAHGISITDNTYADRRIGWRDIVVGRQLEPTHELLRYPNALIGTPRRIATATFQLDPTENISRIVDSEDAGAQIASTAPWLFDPTILSGMFSRNDRTPVWVLLTIVAAFGLGALHAIEPGHGKALLAFTLVGARATPKQALILASSLTFAHTIGVVLLGLVLLSASSFVSETIYPYVTLITGIVIAVIGARALARYVASHLHEHAHDHGHTHAIPGSKPLNFGNAVWAAMGGGIAPCPAAIVVMLTALRLHQLEYGMLLIIVFGMGLASVLTGLGMGVVYGASLLSQQSRFDRIVKMGPLLSATVISVIGAVMVSQGFVQNGFASSTWLVAPIVCTAIAGYALAQRGHAHHSWEMHA